MNGLALSLRWIVYSPGKEPKPSKSSGNLAGISNVMLLTLDISSYTHMSTHQYIHVTYCIITMHYYYRLHFVDTHYRRVETYSYIKSTSGGEWRLDGRKDQAQNNYVSAVMQCILINSYCC